MSGGDNITPAIARLPGYGGIIVSANPSGGTYKVLFKGAGGEGASGETRDYPLPAGLVRATATTRRAPAPRARRPAATRRSSTASTSSPLSPLKWLFAFALAAKTGLDKNVIAAWVLAEGGPDTNPLNIMERGKVKRFPSMKAGLEATARTLASPSYANVRRAAKGSKDAQLQAISVSTWDLGFVGPKPEYLRSLRGSLVVVLGSGGPPKSAGDINAAWGFGGSGLDLNPFHRQTPPLPGLPDLPDLPDAAAGIERAFQGAESWAAKTAVVGGGYLLLTALGVGLILLGARSLTNGGGGVGARTIYPAAPEPSAQTEEIPF